MAVPKETRETNKSVPARMSARVRLVLASLLLTAAVVGGGVWLGSHVNLESAALSTVEQSVSEEPRQSDESVADAAEPGEEPAAEESEPDGEDALSDVQAAEESAGSSINAQTGYSAVEVQPEPEPESEPAPSQSSPSQPQGQQGGSRQTTPSTPTTPVTPQPTPEPDSEPVQPQKISVTLTVDGSAAGVASWSKTVTLDPGSSVYDALTAADGNVNARSTGYGIYVVGIDGLAEKDHGSKSGWMYAVNGSYPNTACSNYVLKSGDSVTWVYVNVDY